MSTVKERDNRRQYYLKDKKARVYRTAGTTEDDLGQTQPEGYYPISPLPLWCYVKQLNQTLSYQAGILYANDEQILFIFNYNKHIKQGAYILYKDTWYAVDRVSTTGDYNSEMYVYGNTLPKHIPKQSLIKDYDADIINTLE